MEAGFDCRQRQPLLDAAERIEARGLLRRQLTVDQGSVILRQVAHRADAGVLLAGIEKIDKQYIGANGGHAPGNGLPVPEQGVVIGHRQLMTGAVGQIKGQGLSAGQRGNRQHVAVRRKAVRKRADLNKYGF
jgi:hypothetical protein